MTMPTYGAAMEKAHAFIRLKLDIDQAIELSEFVGAFTSIASEYERFIRTYQPTGSPEATLYVREVRAGCIEADLVPWLTSAGVVALGAVGLLSAYNVVDEFVERLGNRIGTYRKPGGRLKDVTKSELSDFANQVAAIASSPDSALSVAAIHVENGKERVSVGFRFDTSEAREIQQRIEEHRNEINHSSRADYERKLMVFVRSDIRSSAIGKRSGEQVVIEDISPKARPIIYASDMAEREIKSEINDAEENIYKKGFVVDVNVESRNGKPAAYAITHLHQIIELPDDD